MVGKETPGASADAQPDAAVAEIRRQFDTLKGDLAALSAAVAALGVGVKGKGVAAAADSAGSLAEHGKAAIAEAEAHCGTLFEDMAKTVRAKPFTALAVTAVIGLVLGLFAAPRR